MFFTSAKSVAENPISFSLLVTRHRTALEEQLKLHGFNDPRGAAAELATIEPVVTGIEKLGVGGIWIVRKNAESPALVAKLSGSFGTDLITTSDVMNQRLGESEGVSWFDLESGVRRATFMQPQSLLDLYVSPNPITLRLHNQLLWGASNPPVLAEAAFPKIFASRHQTAGWGQGGVGR